MTSAENYDKGMKMLVKLSKNPNATLYSDIEEKGKGKRMKKPIKHFDSNKENNPKQRRMLPPLPQLTYANKSSHSSQPLPGKVDKIKRPFVDNAEPSKKHVKKSISVSEEINVSREISKNKDYRTYKEVSPIKESSMEMHKSKSAAVSSEKKCSSEEFSSSSGCKICPINQQKCAYTSREEVTMESLAHTIYHLNGKLKMSFNIIYYCM